MAVKLASAVKESTWNSRIPFPRNAYKVQIVEEDRKPSKGGNPMVTLTWEIFGASPVQIGDVKVDVNGTQITSWHVTKVNPTQGKTPEETEKSSQAAFDNYSRTLELLGVNIKEGWDDENPPPVKGIKAHALVYGEENPSYQAPTPEQLAKGEKHGDPVKDPVTGKDVITYVPRIGQIFGLYAGEDGAKPF